MSARIQNGTTTAHGRTWPMYEHSAFRVEVDGPIPVESTDNLEALRDELDAVLSKYNVKAQVRLVQVLSMRPEDRIEKNALDEAAVQH